MTKRLATMFTVAALGVAGVMTTAPSATAAPAANDYSWFYSGTNFSGQQVGLSVWQNDQYYDLTLSAHSVINNTEYAVMGASLYNASYCFRAGAQWPSIGAPFSDTPGNQLRLAKAVTRC